MKKGNPTPLTPFAVFHIANRGYNFSDRATGYVFTKMDMWIKFHDNQEALLQLTENKHPHYFRVDKPDWKKGILKVKSDYYNLKKKEINGQ